MVGSSLNGSYSESGQSETFTGSASPYFNFNTPALLSDIIGIWSGAILDGESAAATMSSNGTFTGLSNLGCVFSGTITPDSSNNNFFDVSLTFGRARGYCRIKRPWALLLTICYQMASPGSLW